MRTAHWIGSAENLMKRLDGSPTVAGIVPSGFERYLRIFSPVGVSSNAGAGTGGSDARDEANVRDEAIHRAEDRCAQPARARRRSVAVVVIVWHGEVVVSHWCSCGVRGGCGGGAAMAAVCRWCGGLAPPAAHSRQATLARFAREGSLAEYVVCAGLRCSPGRSLVPGGSGGWWRSSTRLAWAQIR